MDVFAPRTGKVVLNGGAFTFWEGWKGVNWLLMEVVFYRRSARGRDQSLPSNAEEGHELLQGFGLCRQFLRRAGEFLRRRRITLRHRIDRGHRFVDLRDS